MTSPKVTRKVYSADELHRLRDTQSQPKLREAIEEHDGEDADIVKEHVLRGSRSFAARSFRSRASANSLRVPSAKSNNENLSGLQEPVRQPLGVPSQFGNGVLGEIVPNGQMLRPGTFKFGPSPTPSMKKRKAEAIVKAHGSPTHVRVTAGGRIVPSEQSPLCHPRYGYSAIKTNGGLIKFAPNHYAGKPQWTRATEDGFVAQDVHGNLCQIVNGTILPLHEVDGALRLYMPAPNLQVTQRGSSMSATNPLLAAAPGQALSSVAPAIAQPAEPPIASQIAALELEYSKLEHELKDVDKTEVIHGRTMGKVAKDALIAKRRELVVSMDKIRKALKELKIRPPPNAPTSPRAMLNKRSASPSRNRLPPFLQAHTPGNMLPVQQAAVPAHSHYYNPPTGQYAVQPTPSPEEIWTGQSWNMPPASMFMPPPPFDGSVAPSFSAMGTPLIPNNGEGQQVAAGTSGQDIPQHDGALACLGRFTISPNRSRAVSIKVPEPKAGIKSALNPMSPVYKPATAQARVGLKDRGAVPKSAKDCAPTPPSPMRGTEQPFQTQNGSGASTETINPSKKNAHMHSSSISSFDTADFFPRNTREYSTRQHAYPFHNDHIEDKENADPERMEHSPVTPAQHAVFVNSCGQRLLGQTPQTIDFQGPTAPPGTPAYSHDSQGRPLAHTGLHLDLPDREADNVSPKTKRERLFVQEHPEQLLSLCEKPPASADKMSTAKSSLNLIDFSQKPREWIEGYQAGLQRKAVSADRMGKFLDGYCAGLLKSKVATDMSNSNASSTSSPMKPISRRPSPVGVSRTSSRLHLVEAAPTIAARQSLEARIESLDTLKQAVFAPQNEDAVLTPAPDGPHVSKISVNLGAWAKEQRALPKSLPPVGNVQNVGVPSYFLPQRTSSMVPDQQVVPERRLNTVLKEKALPPEPQHRAASSDVHFEPDPTAIVPCNLAHQAQPSAVGVLPHASNRVTSITSIDSTMCRQWPNNRIVTPLEWKSGSSVAHAAGLATGYFSHAQFDGTHDVAASPGPRTDDFYSSGAAQMQRVGSVTSAISTAEYAHRYREHSLDGITNSPTSPAAPTSPAMTPRDTPVKDSSKRKDSSPAKTPSPTKAKFEHIAGKVGIKVAAANKQTEQSVAAFEPGSPPDKRRWRDIWHKGGKEAAR